MSEQITAAENRTCPGPEPALLSLSLLLGAALLAGAVLLPLQLLMSGEALSSGPATVLFLDLIPATLAALLLLPFRRLWVRAAAPGAELCRHRAGIERTLGRVTWFFVFFAGAMAVVPFPLFSVMYIFGPDVPDQVTGGLLLGAGAVFATAFSVALAYLLASGFAPVARRLSPAGPGFISVYALCFPLPWVLLPVLLAAVLPEALGGVSGLLLAGLLLVLLPLCFALLRHFPQRLVHLMAGLGVVVLLSLGVANASGRMFSGQAAAAVPLADRIYPALKALTDLDGDGYSRLFEGLDCDEADPRVNFFAFDKPGNGIDENCDGQDANRKGLLSWAPRTAYKPENARPYNVIFIMADTLRADHLGFMGYSRNTSPNLDGMAARALLFKRHYATSPSTAFSVASMLSGLYPPQIAWEKPKSAKDFVMAPANRLLTDYLSAAGWFCGAVTDAWINAHMVGLGEHFDSFKPLYPRKKWKTAAKNASPGAVTRAMQFIEARENRSPFFLFLHMEEPHEPYIAHGPPADGFGEAAIDRYDSDIRWMDHWLGIFFSYLEGRGLMDNTVIVFTSDHGEEFGEHRKYFHNHQLFQESIHVPMFVRIPGMPGKEVSTESSHVDILPTMLDVLGVPSDGKLINGVSLLRLADGNVRPGKRPVFSLVFNRSKSPDIRQVAAIRKNLKVIMNLNTGRSRYYNLLTDPAEQRAKDTFKAAGPLQLQNAMEEFLSTAHPSWSYY